MEKRRDNKYRWVGHGQCALAAVSVIGMLAVGSCSAGTGSSSGSGGAGPQGGTGGGTSTGGVGADGSGGRSAGSGGGTSNTGGTTGAGSGGTGTGGAQASGGSIGSGGAPGSGGSSGASGGASGGNSSGGALGSGGSAAGGGGAAGGTAGVNLFNGTDLTGFDAYRETAATSPGTLLSAADALKIFKVEDGAIRVYGDAADKSTQSRHTLVTKSSYAKFTLWMEYKWGTKVYAPYTDLTKYPRDAGILWYIHNDRTQVWPSSIELQIKDGSTGDIFALYARCTSLGKNGGTTFAEMADGGTSKLVDGSTGFTQHIRSANFEIAGWNAIELQVDNGAAVFIVNGHIVNRVLTVTNKNGQAVTTGPIAFQAEHAEVFYRNIRIQVTP